MGQSEIKVLLVEDNPGDVRLIQELLKEAGGSKFEFTHVTRLMEMETRLQSFQADILLLDLGLPESQGLETLKRAKAVASHLPIIILTGLLGDELGSEAIANGAQDYLIKGRVDGPLLVRAVQYAIERQRADAAVRESEQQLSSIYDTVGDVIFHLAVEKDGRYRFISVNQAFVTTTGIDSAQVVGKLVNEIIPEPSLTMVLEKYREAIREKKIVRWEETSDYPTGRLTGEVSVAPVFDDAGNCTHLVGAVHDVTERKRAEEEIRKLNEELEERVKQRTAQLEAANKELEAFSYSVSHDLRAPLRAIDGFSRLLIEEHSSQLDHEGQRFLKITIDSTAKMGQLIDDLLAFSRLGRQEMRKWSVDMTNLAQTVVEEAKKAEPGRTIEVIIHALNHANCDGTMIRQVFSNLISNAFKFTRRQANPRVEIGSYPESRDTVYFVKDNGAGFDMQYVNKLFGVFQRLHRQDEYEGTGVGLGIVQRVVHRHGGRAWAEGKVNEGATFYFTLPMEGEKSS